MRRIIVLVAMSLVGVACGGGTPKSANPPTTSPPSTQPAATPNVISLSGRAFSPAYLSVARDTTVTWRNGPHGDCPNFVGEDQPCPHNVVSVAGLFNSHPQCTGPGTPCMKMNEEFQYTFSTPGTFVYYCHVHASCTGGTCGGMSGRVIVT